MIAVHCYFNLFANLFLYSIEKEIYTISYWVKMLEDAPFYPVRAC